MPRIIVQADPTEPPLAGATMTLEERVVPSQLESPHYSAQLVERLTWAVEDAARVECSEPAPDGGQARPAAPRRQPPAQRARPRRDRIPVTR